MKRELAKTYDPKGIEDRIYQMWCDRGYFTPDPANPAPAFSVVIPPPNVTGQLHMGHALDEGLGTCAGRDAGGAVCADAGCAEHDEQHVLCVQRRI